MLVVSRFITFLLLFLCITETIWGSGQILGLLHSKSYCSTPTGSFYNSGPFGGILAVTLPILLENLYRARMRLPWVEWLLWLTAIYIVSLIIVSESRAACLALGVPVIYLIGVHKKELPLRFLSHPMFILAIVAGLLIVLTGSYYLKKDSADGRMFIWRIAILAIKEQPLTGYGWDHVAGIYGEQQEAFFASDQGTEHEEKIADAPEYMFNEYLQISMAWGIPSLIVSIIIISFTLHSGHLIGTWGLNAGLLSFMVFAFFSYPLQAPEFTVSLFLIIIGIHSQSRYKMLSLIVSIVCTILFFFYLLAVVRRHHLNEAWLQRQKSQQELYNEMKWNAKFLFSYGYRLHKRGLYQDSEKVIQDGIFVSSDPMFLLIQGKNAWYQQRPEEAEQWFLRATQRVPNRIYPYYLLAKLYSDSAYFNKNKFDWASNIVMIKPPKVYSTAIQQMREEINKLKQEICTEQAPELPNDI